MTLYPKDTPKILTDFFGYLNMRGLSPHTINAYYIDLRTFFRYLKYINGLAPDNAPFEKISIADADETLINNVTTSTLYDYLQFARNDLPKFVSSDTTTYGNELRTIARKVSSLRTYFKYLTEVRHILTENPAASLTIPKQKKTLPKYLTINECYELLKAVDGPFRQRDYCILVLFLNCGLRVSELAGLNIGDISTDSMRVTGKGNKQRMIYLNDSCVAALHDYMPTRLTPEAASDRDALFISRNRKRISVQTVKWLVSKYLNRAGLGQKELSTHKLRHTAATLMYQNGVDIRTLQEFLGHEQVNTTMIYTHLSDTSIRDAARSNPLSELLPEDVEKIRKDNKCK